MSVLISFIVPVYNSKKYLSACVESLLNQGLEEDAYEIILVNDGSTDNSLDLCRSLSSENPRIKVFTQENKGIGGARNTGIKKAAGEYLCFVDSDDTIIPNGISFLLDYCDGESDLIRFWCNLVYSGGRTMVDMGDGSVSFFGSGHDYLRLYGLETFCWNYLFRKSFVLDNELYFKSRIVGEDFSYMFDVMMADPRIKAVSRRIYQYNINSNSISTTWTVDNSKRWTNDLIGTLARIVETIGPFQESDPVLYESCKRSLDRKTISLFSRILSAKYSVKEFREIISICKAAGIIPLTTRSDAVIFALIRFPFLYPIASFMFRRVFLQFIYPKIDRNG